MIPARIVSLAAIAAATLLAQLAYAQGKDELWEMTTKVEMEGMPMGMPAQTSKVCMEKGKSEAMVPQGDSKCRMVSSKQSGNKFTFRMECAEPEKMTGEGEITRTQDRMSGTMRLKGEDMAMTQTFSGRRVGSCDATAHRREQMAQYEKPAQEARAKNCGEAVDKLDPSPFMTQSYEANLSAEQKAQMRKMAGCDDYKPKFCAKASEIGKSMREPKGYTAAHSRYRRIDDALRACDQDPKKIAAAACQSGVRARDWQFVSDRCPAEAKTVAAKNCVGRDYTEVMAKVTDEFRNLCVSHAPQRGIAAARSERRSEPAEKKDGEESAAGSAIKEGTNVLRKFLKF